IHVGFQFQGFFVGLGRLSVPARPVMGKPKIVVSVGVLGVDFNRLGAMFDGLIVFPPQEEDRGKIAMGLRVAGPEFQDFFIGLNGAGVIVALVVSQADVEIGVGFFGIDRECSLVAFYGLWQEVRRAIGVAQLQSQRGILRNPFHALPAYLDHFVVVLLFAPERGEFHVEYGVS